MQKENYMLYTAQVLDWANFERELRQGTALWGILWILCSPIFPWSIMFPVIYNNRVSARTLENVFKPFDQSIYSAYHLSVVFGDLQSGAAMTWNGPCPKYSDTVLAEIPIPGRVRM